jgi:hypothetical protein
LADARGENAEPNDRELSLQEERWAIWRYWQCWLMLRLAAPDRIAVDRVALRPKNDCDACDFTVDFKLSTVD